MIFAQSLEDVVNEGSIGTKEFSSEYKPSNQTEIYSFSAPEYIIQAELYVDNGDYNLQNKKQIWDFSRNADFKRIHLSTSAGDIGAWAYTTITDRNIVIDPSLIFAPRKFRVKVIYDHEMPHPPTEQEARYLENDINSGPKMPQYSNFRPGV